MKSYKLGVWIFTMVVAAFMGLSGLSLGKELSREEIVEGAKKEGELIIYYSGVLDRMQKIVNKFNNKYPFINVRLWEAAHSTVYQRLQTEKAAGKPNADLIEIQNPLYFIHLKNTGMLLYYLSPEDKHYRHLLDVKRHPRGVGELRYDPGYWTPLNVSFQYIAYRTDKWSKEDAPKSWRDLLNPKYKGKIVAADPRYGEEGKTYFYDLKEQLGIDYLKKLAKNDLMLVSKGMVVQLKLTTGELSIGLLSANNFYETVLDDKAPLDFNLPEEGTIARSNGIVAILKDAIHPNCARLFLDHHLSKEIVELRRDGWYQNGVRDDFMPKENTSTLETVKKIWPSDPDKFNKELPEFLREFVRIFGL